MSNADRTQETTELKQILRKLASTPEGGRLIRFVVDLKSELKSANAEIAELKAKIERMTEESVKAECALAGQDYDDVAKADNLKVRESLIYAVYTVNAYNRFYKRISGQDSCISMLIGDTASDMIKHIDAITVCTRKSGSDVSTVDLKHLLKYHDIGGRDCLYVEIRNPVGDPASLRGHEDYLTYLVRSDGGVFRFDRKKLDMFVTARLKAYNPDVSGSEAAAYEPHRGFKGDSIIAYVPVDDLIHAPGVLVERLRMVQDGRSCGIDFGRRYELEQVQAEEADVV